MATSREVGSFGRVDAPWDDNDVNVPDDMGDNDRDAEKNLKKNPATITAELRTLFSEACGIEQSRDWRISDPVRGPTDGEARQRWRGEVLAEVIRITGLELVPFNNPEEIFEWREELRSLLRSKLDEVLRDLQDVLPEFLRNLLETDDRRPQNRRHGRF